MRWLQRIARDAEPLAHVLDALAFFQTELAEGRKLLHVQGTRIVSKLNKIPLEIEHHFRNLQEIEQILKIVEKVEERKIVETTQWYMDHYQRKIVEQTAKKYAEAHMDVHTIYLLRCEVAMVRNDYLALFKGLETQAFKLKDVVELHKNMLEDAVFV